MAIHSCTDGRAHVQCCWLSEGIPSFRVYRLEAVLDSYESREHTLSSSHRRRELRTSWQDSRARLGQIRDAIVKASDDRNTRK